MDNRAIALKLILDHLETADISTVEQRMEVQKAIYLVQSTGMPLGYSYGWYLKGPYSPTLTRDYYSLGDEGGMQNATLKASAIGKLDNLKELINQPIGGLGRPHRLELLASLHYLIKNSRFSEDKARQRIRETKSHLADHVTAGLAALRGHGLL
jgi:hypothetical protein